jgi:hypothetical protein
MGEAVRMHVGWTTGRRRDGDGLACRSQRGGRDGGVVNGRGRGDGKEE